MIESYNKSKNKIIMVWACFGGNSLRSDLVFMPGYSDSKRGMLHLRYTWKFLKNSFQHYENLVSISCKITPPIRAAGKIKSWLNNNNGIDVAHWPPYTH